MVAFAISKVGACWYKILQQNRFIKWQLAGGNKGNKYKTSFQVGMMGFHEYNL